KQMSTRSGGPAVVNISMYADIAKFLGYSTLKDVTECKGNSSANPSETAFFILSAFGSGTGIDAGEVRCRIRIEYSAIMSDPIQPSSS
uniref:hypothetical protein n=1 Tax=Polynucleobacter sp. TaxID=2029855 RepID=UPI004048E9B2